MATTARIRRQSFSAATTSSQSARKCFFYFAHFPFGGPLVHRETSCCLKKTEPLFGFRIPRINRRIVVLPAPLCPMTTRRSCGSTSSDTSSSTFLSPKRTPTLRSSTICRVALLGDFTADNVAFISQNVIRETCSFYGARQTHVL